MVGVRFKVSEWRAWAPGLETLEAWLHWAGVGNSVSVNTWPSTRLPPLLQRRAGSLGQKAISSVLGCAGASDCRYVLASQHGDLGRTVGLLRSLALKEALSPTDFTMSVHHALVGLISIHTGNREGHTAVAAAADTFGFGFLEAAAYVAAESKPAMLVYLDDPMPEDYREFRTSDETGALVVVAQIEPPAGDGLDCVFSATPNAKAADRTACREAQVTPLDFLRFLLVGCASITSPGERMDWRWQRA